ncbi:hypothetical protein RB597_003808 [Gaeumannomyces tritici]
MVQYVFTPWKHRRELLEVRGQFYPELASAAAAAAAAAASSHPGRQRQRQRSHPARDSSHACATRAEGQRRAVSRVSVWMQRGGCPHLVESTAMLVDAMLADEASGGSYAVRGAYSTAFGRFVTGLLDSHQDKSHKMSMYSVAKTIGLPATFVELRHQAAHEQLPSLTRLRAGAAAGLDWIWEYYWKQLALHDDGDAAAAAAAVVAAATGEGSSESRGGQEEDGACRAALLRHLRDGAEAAAAAAGDGDQDWGSAELCALADRWGRARVLRVLDAVGDEAASSIPMDGGLVLGTLRLSRRVAGLDLPQQQQQPADFVQDAGALRADLERSRRELAEMEALAGAQHEEGERNGAGDGAGDAEVGAGGGWTRPELPWRAKPIGVV